MKIILKISVLALLLVSTSSCFFDGVKGDGNVITKDRKISNDFIRIKANKGLEVYLTKNDEVSLTVEADENLHELIKTEVKDGTLYITSKKNIWSSRAKKIHLSVEDLNEISVSSGAEIHSENTFYSDELQVNASSGAVAKLRLDIINLICETSSGANVDLIGKVKNIETKSSSGSDIDAYELKTLICVAKASSGSNIRVNVKESFKGNATSGAVIRFKGDPKIIKSDENSGGSIKSKHS